MKKTATDSPNKTAKSKPVQSAPAVDQEAQSRVFDAAVAMFRSGDFAAAEKLFQKAADGPALEVSHAARVRARICARRIDRPAPALASAEEHYNYAVTLLNRREFQAAEAHLQAALGLEPNGDHIHYALALSRSLGGETQLAAASLHRAIELDPRNRTRARSDPDFAEFTHLRPFAALLFPDKERHP